MPSHAVLHKHIVAFLHLTQGSKEPCGFLYPAPVEVRERSGGEDTTQFASVKMLNKFPKRFWHHGIVS